MKRSVGERIRLKHSIARLRTTIDSVEKSLTLPGCVGLEASGALLSVTAEVAMQIAKLDAYELVEEGILNAESAVAARVQQAMLNGSKAPTGRWRILAETSPSGKTLFVCLSCGDRVPSPSANCLRKVRHQDGVFRECKDWEPSTFEVQ